MSRLPILLFAGFAAAGALHAGEPDFTDKSLRKLSLDIPEGVNLSLTRGSDESSGEVHVFQWMGGEKVKFLKTLGPRKKGKREWVGINGVDGHKSSRYIIAVGKRRFTKQRDVTLEIVGESGVKATLDLRVTKDLPVFARQDWSDVVGLGIMPMEDVNYSFNPVHKIVRAR